MGDSFEITFREMLPDSSIVEWVRGQLAKVPRSADWHCRVVLHRLGTQPACFRAHIELRSSWDVALQSEATATDAWRAVRGAFADAAGEPDALCRRGLSQWSGARERSADLAAGPRRSACDERDEH